MLKKILIGLGVLVIILAVALFYLNYRNRSLSPPGSASLTNGDLTVSVTYSRPSVRNRVIFGPAGNDALQPYGEYWRLGANESTEIAFNTDVQFNGERIRKGTYRMYAVPGETAFEVGLNSELGTWGYSEPDYSKDVLKTRVTVQRLTTPVEQFTITLSKAENGIDVVCDWERVRLSIPVRK